MYRNGSIDITTFTGDAIVNSLGAGEYIEQPGRIYRSILNASKDPDALMAQVTEQGKNLPFGSVYATDSFGLPCKRIIHVITPFRTFDRDHSQIAKCYEDLLQLSLKEGIKSICVPVIGTGANGYRSDKVASIARRICYRFAEEHPEIDVVFNVYSVEFGPDEKERRMEFGRSEKPLPRHREESVPNGRSRHIDADERGIREGAAEAPKPQIPFLEEIGIEDEDSFATLVRKCVFARTKGSKKVKEEALEDVWLDINSLVGNLKEDSTSLEGTVNSFYEIKEKGLPTGKAFFVSDEEKKKPTHCPKYEWKKVKNTKGKGYVSQRPNKAEILLASIALHLKPEEVMEVYEFCGFSLSKYERHERAFRECVALVRKRDPWTRIVKAYRFATSESLYDYREERRKIYDDYGEKW